VCATLVKSSSGLLEVPMFKWSLAVLALGLVPALAMAQDQPRKPGEKPSNIQLTEQQKNALKQQFNRMDKDKDGYVDLTEAAKFFRGINAKPLEAGVKQRAGDNPFDPANLEQKPAEKPMTKPPAKPMVVFQDQLFFEACDANGDDKVSLEEYEAYTIRSMQEQARLIQQQQQQLQNLQRQLQQATQQQQQLLRQQMQQVQQQLQRLQQQQRNGNYNQRWMQGRG